MGSVGQAWWGRQGSNLRPRDYESPALTTELLPLGWSFDSLIWVIQSAIQSSEVPLVENAQSGKGTGFKRVQVEKGIRQIGRARWEVQVHVGRDPLTGKLQQRSRTTTGGIRAARKLRAETISQLANEKTELENDRDETTRRSETFGHLLDEWIAHGKRRGRSPSTIAGYEKKIDATIRPALGCLPVSDITAHVLDEFYSRLLDNGTSPATVMHHHRIISAALTQARKWGAVIVNVAQDATPPSVPKKALSVPPPARVRALIELAAASKSPEWGPIITFAALTGMRRGELCGLQWKDVDWESSAITVRRSIWQTKGKWGEKDPKSHQVRRLILGNQTAALLADRFKRANDNATLADHHLQASAYVFSPDIEGTKPLLPGAVTLAFRRLCNTMADRTNEEWPYRFHDLRHYTASELFRAGHHARTVADRLGHADPSLTLRVYTHVTGDQAQLAAEAIEVGILG